MYACIWSRPLWVYITLYCSCSLKSAGMHTTVKDGSPTVGQNHCCFFNKNGMDSGGIRLALTSARDVVAVFLGADLPLITKPPAQSNHYKFTGNESYIQSGIMEDMAVWACRTATWMWKGDTVTDLV